MKKFLSIVLMFVFTFSLFSCGIKDEDDDTKYKDGALKYVTLPDYKGHKVTINKDAIQQTVDQYLLSNAKDYKAKSGDDVYLDIISVKKVEYIKNEQGTTIDQEGEEIAELEGERFVKNLGSGSYFKNLEIRAIGLKIGDILTQKITLPSDFYEEKYRDEEVYIKFKLLNMACRRGDVVDVEYTGYYIDENNEIIYENGKKKSFDSGSSSFYLGSHLAIDDFEKGIVGMKVGDTKQFFSTFPDDYGVEDLKGKKVIFECKLKSIKQADVYNNDFVKENYDFDTVEEFEKHLVESEMQNSAILNIIENIKVNEIPEKEYKKIENNINQEAEEFEKAYNIKFDQYLERYMGMTREEYIKNLLKTELAYYAIAEKENITVNDEEFTKEKKRLIEQYKNRYMDDYKLTESEALDSATRYVNEYIGDTGVRESLLFEAVRQHIYANTQTEIKEATYTSVTKEIADRYK